MIKDKLVQLCDIRKEIIELEQKIKKLEDKGVLVCAVEGSYNRPPFTKHSILIESANPELLEKDKYYKSILQQRLNDLLDVQIEVEEYIDSIPISRLRRIFELRYIEQHGWQKIAYMMKGNATADSVRKEHDRFLQ